MSLRVLAQGVAGPAYGQIFSFGVSGSIKKALGMLVPGLPLFVAAAFSLAAYSVRGLIFCGKKIFILYSLGLCIENNQDCVPFVQMNLNTSVGGEVNIPNIFPLYRPYIGESEAPGEWLTASPIPPCAGERSRQRQNKHAFWRFTAKLRII